MEDAAKIRRDYFDKLNSLNMSQMDMWRTEEKITDTLYEKGYGLTNVSMFPCTYGRFNGLDCDSYVADKLANEIRKQGFEIIIRKNPNRKSTTWIIFPFNLIIELENAVEKFEAIK